MNTSTLIKAQLQALAIFEANNICMTIKECAVFLEKHRDTIANQIHAGKITATLVGQTYSIPKIQFLEQIIEKWNTEQLTAVA